jgi:hypothetical protein
MAFSSEKVELLAPGKRKPGAGLGADRDGQVCWDRSPITIFVSDMKW